jgi:hypothetical protein
MTKYIITLILLLSTTGSLIAKEYSLENTSLRRSIIVENGVLKTKAIENKLAKKTAVPLDCAEFRLRISKGTHITGTDVELTSADFKIAGVSSDEGKLVFTLKNAEYGLDVKVHYIMEKDKPWARKYLEITPQKEICVERVDVEALSLKDAYQPYKMRLITANGPGRWKPGLGQPLYTTNSATFWGIEFPAAYNFVKNKSISCGYLWGRTVKAGETYTSYKAVVGVGDNPEFIHDSFLDYIAAIRIRPLRLQIQYNSWFDYGNSVNREKFLESVNRIHSELVEKRGNRPLRAYVIDDGWQNTKAAWTDMVWKVNNKFDPDFASVKKAVESRGSHLGIWMSPGCLFGAQRAVPAMRDFGWEALDNWMSMAGPKYMAKLEERMVGLTKSGITYFKLDGLFGHLNIRNFELHGDRYGIPYMPQLNLEGVTGNSDELNKAKYNELKTYYLVAGTERLIRLFKNMTAANPEVYIVISNGAYLSPWWLQHIDSVWMINAGDAAEGANRTKELVYRDGRYYEIFTQEKTQFPMCALFNHEPKKVKSGETEKSFRRYLYMSLSRGTGFIELYLKTFKLQKSDWDVLSECLHWSYKVFPTFQRSRMHGGNPQKGEVYGYTAWTKNQGYISLHNPGEKAQKYSIRLDRKFGLLPGSGTFKLSSPIEECTKGLKPKYNYGDTLTLEMKPREIRILNFDKIF